MTEPIAATTDQSCCVSQYLEDLEQRRREDAAAKAVELAERRASSAAAAPTLHSGSGANGAGGSSDGAGNLHNSSAAHSSGSGIEAGVQNGVAGVGGGNGKVAAPVQQKKLLRLGYRELQVRAAS